MDRVCQSSSQFQEEAPTVARSTWETAGEEAENELPLSNVPEGSPSAEAGRELSAGQLWDNSWDGKVLSLF